MQCLVLTNLPPSKKPFPQIYKFSSFFLRHRLTHTFPFSRSKCLSESMRGAHVTKSIFILLLVNNAIRDENTNQFDTQSIGNEK